MPSANWSLENYRIDSRGHVVAVQLKHIVSVTPYLEEWWWYRADGSRYDYAQGVIYPKGVLHLRLDARGHVFAVLAYHADGFRWYDLAGNVLAVEDPPPSPYVTDIRLDTRGHVLAVYRGAWYNLAAQAA